MKQIRVYAAVLAAVSLLGAGMHKGDFNGDEDTSTPVVTDASVGNSYIVGFTQGVDRPDAEAVEMVGQFGVSVEQAYKHAFKGFSARIPAKQLAKLQADPRVAFVAEDRELHAFAQTTPTGIKRVGAAVPTSNIGSGITVAVLDTGIDVSHPDLASAIVATKSCSSGRPGAKDDNGHGTHVAGTIAARNNSIGVLGVAPGVGLAAVKVLDKNGSGTWSSIICGIDWVTANTARYNIKVANMSLGGSGVSDNNCGFSNNDPLHMALCNSRNAGVTYVVAAGNSAANTSATVPAGYDDAVITVSALADSDGAAGGAGAATSYGPDDTFATFSNFGSAVDIAAPGVSIYSSYKGGTYATLSGTSMASPHVAGAAALYIKSHPGSTWTQVRAGLQAAGEPLGAGHTDPSGKHPEPVLRTGSF